MKTEEFIKMLRESKNPEKITAMENYMRNQFQFLGLQATERRALAKDFLKQQPAEVDWELLFRLWELPEREFQLIGLDYLKQVVKHLDLEDFSKLRKLVLTKSWWDTIDALSKIIGALVLKEPQLTAEMKKWSLEENIWIRRVSILHQLAYKEETNITLLHEIILNNIHDDEFFIQKAIGWALREYAKTDEDWVRDFVQTHQNNLSKLSYREATKNLK